MSHAVIGMFDSAADAAQARQQLISAGISPSDIQTSSAPGAGTSDATRSASEDKGFWASVKEMFGAEDTDEAGRHVSYYTEGTRRGGVVLTVNADEANADEVASTLQAAGAIDIDAKAREWQQSGWSGHQEREGDTSTARADASAANPGAVRDAAGKIDVVKEEIEVGKRVVNRGGVRIVKQVRERPVEQDVNLREERVTVDRRAVDRPLQGTEADKAFKEESFEVQETGEEAVAAKTARVVGEVVVGKTAEQRTEKVRDTVRETDVQVEKRPGQGSAATSKAVEDVDRSGTTRSAKSEV